MADAVSPAVTPAATPAAAPAAVTPVATPAVDGAGAAALSSETTAVEGALKPVQIDSSIIGDANPAPDGDAAAAEGDAGADGKDGATEGDKPADGTVAYDITLPDGFSVDDATMGQFKNLAAEAKLPPETAQKFADLYASRVAEIAQAPYQLWADTQKQWQDAVKTDPELGGKNYDQTNRACAALFQFGPDNPFVQTKAEADALRQAFIFTGAGNQPDIVRLIARLGATRLEGGPVPGGAPAPQKKSAAETLYPPKEQ